MTGTKTVGFWLLFITITAAVWSIPNSAQLELVANTQLKILTIPVAVFVVDGDDENTPMSSQRRVDSMQDHFQQVNKIWAQAGIRIKPVTVKRISVSGEFLYGLIHKRGRGGIASFFRAIRHGEIEVGQVNNRAVIWTFYVRSLGGPNGLKPQGVNSIFVVDNPLNKDYRVTSHEIGHILGLYHPRHDSTRLLYPGSNGLSLNNEEITVARYNAKRLLR